MRLCEALQVQKGEVVALVGAGGKTTAMYRLGRELAGQGRRVIITTTTMIQEPTLQAGEGLVVEEDRERALALTQETLGQSHLVTLVARRLPIEFKLKGVPPEWIASLRPLADVVLIEADGSKRLPLKAPAAHEPVIPEETTLLVPVAGMDAVGQPLGEGTVHRPELVATLTGLAMGAAITPAAVAAVLAHPQGGLKNAPAGARIIPLLNKVQGKAALEAARAIAAQVMRRPEIQRVLIAAVAADEPVIECWRHVAAVVLAAGGSRRMGRPKQLLPVDGRVMIEHALEAVRSTSAEPVIVVLGHAAAEIAPHIPADCQKVLNPDWETGIASSIRAGLEAVPDRAEAVLFVLADQPRLTGAALQRILHAYYGTGKAIVNPVYKEQRGVPALFDRRMFPALRALQGDVGGREVIRQFPAEVLPVEMDTPEMFLDVDTAADYEQLLQQGSRPR